MNVKPCHIHILFFYTTFSANAARQKRLIYSGRAYKTCYSGKRYSESTSHSTLTLPHHVLTRKPACLGSLHYLASAGIRFIHAFNRNTTARHVTVIRFSFFNLSKNILSRRFIILFRRYKDRQPFSLLQQSLKKSPKYSNSVEIQNCRLAQLPLNLLFRCKLHRYCRNVSDCQSVTRFRPRSRSLAANVRAAWRRRGVRYSSRGTQTVIFPLHFPRRYTPACAKPPVICWHSILHSVLT